jgi:hypothetical protein
VTNESSKVIPFGKHKGRLVDEVLVDDPGYLEWLTAQDWFRAKFTVLHQVIINRGAEPEETPDHNAMQAKFLDDEFCLRFLQHLIPDYNTRARNKFNGTREKNLQFVIEKIEAEKEDQRENDKKLNRELERIVDFNPDHEPERRQAYAHEQHALRRDQHIERTRKLNQMRELLSPVITAVEFKIERGFEVRGIDVILKIWTNFYWAWSLLDYSWSYSDRGRWSDSEYWNAGFAIELKPTVGDDYPAVLRQMKRTGADVLVVGNYTGAGATREQFVKTMATEGVRVVFVEEITGEDS